MATSTNGFRRIFSELIFGRGWAQQLFTFQSPAVHWMARTSSLNCLSCRNPYQTTHSLNCLPPFHWKPLFFTEKCFVASPPPKSALIFHCRTSAGPAETPSWQAVRCCLAPPCESDFIHLQCWETLPFMPFSVSGVMFMCPKGPELYTPLALTCKDGRASQHWRCIKLSLPRLPCEISETCFFLWQFEWLPIILTDF